MTALGMLLLVVGAVVAIAEAHYPTQGVAGGIGVVMLAVGAVLAISGLGAGLAIGLLTGLLLAGAGTGAVLFSVRNGRAVRARRIRTGAEGMIGHIGVVRDWTEPAGNVSVDGALWKARRSPGADDEPPPELHSGDTIVVERINGLTLSVRPAEEWELPL
ncbi:MAG: NfeD family protein [Solirubrobacteraceae bacterium]